MLRKKIPHSRGFEREFLAHAADVGAKCDWKRKQTHLHARVSICLIIKIVDSLGGI